MSLRGTKKIPSLRSEQAVQSRKKRLRLPCSLWSLATIIYCTRLPRRCAPRN